jgi:hypothetical protein
VKYADKPFRVFQRLDPEEDFEGPDVGLTTIRHMAFFGPRYEGA